MSSTPDLSRTNYRLACFGRHVTAVPIFATPTRKIAIHYGDGPGRGEVTRMLLAAGGIDYEDNRYSGEQFQKDTAPTPENKTDPTGGSRYPFNQMPSLEIDGVFYAQTSSIARYAARLAGLYPHGLEEALKSDEIFEHTGEIQYSTTPIFMDGVPGRAGTKMRSKDERTSGFQEWSKTKLPVMMAQLARLLGEDDWFCANQFSWADVAVMNRLENLNSIAAAYGVEVLSSYPKLKAHSERVCEVPPIKSYIEARADLMRKNGTYGKASSGTYGGPGHYKITGYRGPGRPVQIAAR